MLLQASLLLPPLGFLWLCRVVLDTSNLFWGKEMISHSRREGGRIRFTRDRFCYLIPLTPEASKMRPQNDLSPARKLMVEHCWAWGWRERSNVYTKFLQYKQFFTCQKSILCSLLLSAHLASLAPFRLNTKPQYSSSQRTCQRGPICLRQ